MVITETRDRTYRGLDNPDPEVKPRLPFMHKFKRDKKTMSRHWKRGHGTEIVKEVMVCSGCKEDFGKTWNDISLSPSFEQIVDQDDTLNAALEAKFQRALEKVNRVHHKVLSRLAE